MTIILGIDPGTNKTGWAVINYQNKCKKILDFGSINNSSSLPYAQKILNIAQNLFDIVKKYNVSKAIMEESFVNNNPKTSLVLAMTRGAILLKLTELHIEVQNITPNQVKKNITGSGHASKEQIAKMIKLMLGISDQQSDTNDAIAIALSYV